MRKNQIYLDYAATTPVDNEVFKAMRPFFSSKFGNPMSIHSMGREAAEFVEKARSQTAEFLDCEPNEIIFTSGATESNNQAIKGIVSAHSQKSQKLPHIITTQFEHSCVLGVCQALEKSGAAKITYLPVYREGIVRISDLEKSLRPDTILVSVMYVNNEIGTIQPLAKISEVLGKANRKRKIKILFHTDATQAINYLDCSVNRVGVDLLSLSAHKIYGPKGIGCLYIRSGTPISRILDGGGHEFNLRSGTHNVPGIVGLGKALELVKQERKKAFSQTLKLRNYLIDRILREVPRSKLNGSKIHRTPNNANFTFREVEGEGLLLALDLQGIAVSTGSACSAANLKSSHVLKAIGLGDEESHGSLRITLGRFTKLQDIDFTISAIKESVARLRRIAGKQYN